MDIMGNPETIQSRPQHKRNPSSILKSMMSPKRTAPADAGRKEFRSENAGPNKLANAMQSPISPSDHPQARYYLKEQSSSRDNIRLSPQKSVETRDDNSKSSELHKKTKSSVSLKSLMENEKVKPPKPKSPEKQEVKALKKSKSSTSLSALLSRPKSSKGAKTDEYPGKKGKENLTPPNSANTAPPPIWAQFATQQMQEVPRTTKIPLNDGNPGAGQIDIYARQNHSPSKQRNFYEHEKQMLFRNMEPKARPRSAYFPPVVSKSAFVGAVVGLRKSSMDEGSRSPTHNGNERRPSNETKTSSQRSSVEQTTTSEATSNIGGNINQRGSRVMAAVAAFDGQSREFIHGPNREAHEIKLDTKAIENAFESLLDARNVPQYTRDKMRLLDTNIKANFIMQDKTSSGSSSSTEELILSSADISVNGRPETGQRSKTENEILADSREASQDMGRVESPKKSRPRSRTFTFSKGDNSPAKKQKADRPKSQVSTKPAGLAPSESSKSLTPIGAASTPTFLSRAPKLAFPEDFIFYLRKVQKPEIIEVGKLHKLRQLLRNETVSWVDTFISKGGMTEVVDLLYRVIAVEWREEHEDALLHETLLCLKALCTTSSALNELSIIQTTLFPVLLAMLFDEEKKGPSEFTTRNIIISLLFTYLSTSPSSDTVPRAHTLLSYLRDPSKPEEAQLPGFIASMHHPRPYRVWCKEVVNVTKEVFWIFLHHLNVIQYPPETPDAGASYTSIHFPGDRPPVPAAPYVGGVEWEATNYLAAHLDLLNGLIASLPSRHERNSLRQELRDSGFEKCMGSSLRTCKEKFYGSVHAGLTTWIGAARADGWDTVFVKEGPKRESVRQSPKKGKVEAPPQLAMPKLNLGGGDTKIGAVDDGGWL